MKREKLFSGLFCAGAVTLMVAAFSAPRANAQAIIDNGQGTGCGMFNGKLCKTVTVKNCSGTTCTTETSYYYYDN